MHQLKEFVLQCTVHSPQYTVPSLCVLEQAACAPTSVSISCSLHQGSHPRILPDRTHIIIIIVVITVLKV